MNDRGKVGYVNEFDFAGVKRFYTVKNHDAGFVRAWHAHWREAKYITAIKGAAIFGRSQSTIGRSPRRSGSCFRYTSLLYIPSCYANGFMC